MMGGTRGQWSGSDRGRMKDPEGSLWFKRLRKHTL